MDGSSGIGEGGQTRAPAERGFFFFFFSKLPSVLEAAASESFPETPEPPVSLKTKESPVLSPFLLNTWSCASVTIVLKGDIVNRL